MGDCDGTHSSYGEHISGFYGSIQAFEKNKLVSMIDRFFVKQ